MKKYALNKFLVLEWNTITLGPGLVWTVTQHLAAFASFWRCHLEKKPTKPTGKPTRKVCRVAMYASPAKPYTCSNAVPVWSPLQARAHVAVQHPLEKICSRVHTAWCSSLLCPVVLLSQVYSRHKALKDLSQLQLLTGIVKGTWIPGDCALSACPEWHQPHLLCLGTFLATSDLSSLW